MSLASLISSIICLVMNINAIGGCWFLVTENGFLSPTGPDYYRSGGGSNGIGILTYEWPVASAFHNYYCDYYSPEMKSVLFDAAFNTSVVCGIASIVCMGCAVCLLITLSCIEYSPLALKGIGTLSLGGSLFDILALSAFASKFTKPDYNATFSYGAGLTIASASISLLTALLISKIPPPIPPVFEPRTPERPAHVPGTVTVSTIEMPMRDGKVKSVKTTLEKDGSKSVEEIIQLPAL
jgi:hypothetical protein